MVTAHSTTHGNGFIDLTGKRYGKWLVLSFHSTVNKRAIWLCRCECGREQVVQSGNLVRGKSTQCRPCSRIRHGMIDTPEYGAWKHMLQRCQNPNVPEYHNYGGRGVTVCERWQAFEAFYADMGARPSDKHWLERIDNSLGYSPENCCWATPQEQQRNRRNNRLVTFHGKTQCIAAWAEETGLKHAAIDYRLKVGWTVEMALTTPSQRG
jgi:hypothetical protein